MLSALQLTKHYGSFTALDRLDLEVENGEIFCLLGANGAGKTTTINLFMGFIEASAGQACIDELVVRPGDAKIKQRIGYIPENVMLYPELSGLQNLAYLSQLSGKKYNKTELSNFLQQANLQAEAIHQPVAQYSKGMRQKVGIALALAKEASALFLDEPTSGLDPLASNEFSNLLQQLSQRGVSILMVTHDLFRAKEVANRVGIMKAGQLVEVLDAATVSHSELERIYVEIISAPISAVGA
ncbi:MAG: ATP-binding cassette domain-containing protein [Haliscomenobacter sp.]|uniref:ABC transporter ATP-binding protein n=1 Tax=Haliscomenobacter sp. TaxID=2717303 RepID=UPI0029BACB39|nr:ATP-binding cassette domain-containing protein [Haliscomenobacter sp.]MDX2067750.1 ATP-binding cassette domain-containing protein [Haliscomenobacter sp.]